MDTVPAVLTPEEVATLLRTAERTVYKWIQEGKIPSIRVAGIRRCPTRELEQVLGVKIQPGDLLPGGGKVGSRVSEEARKNMSIAAKARHARKKAAQG
jgi:excisionase family DNA binding protein